ncbi:hypothetical protein [Ilyobacter polytropus]|uniref:Uncharacterized protein n=1 Tax=Ilyobacter polytropus (strain ATCC 51220 / DSM 2926 / LMG 16218 / CuHBu1) TaxID=572544 RepID=E3HBT5_ILYPC|nr:hypothetical protein [Ilyobacter polytropus]ADO83847.1 hypothetical protein Ilyop_2077 [Ilyobacter polytropus DSM 2926]
MRKGISGKSEVLDKLVAKYGDITVVEAIKKEEIEETLRRR